MILKENYKLQNGIEIPKLGLGTWFIENDNAKDVVVNAVKLGYRHIDTAQAYGNEVGVGEGIKVCGISREELFITTKLAAEVKSYDDAVKSIESSLANLDVDYIDLMLIHSPQPWMEYGADEDRCFDGNVQAWRALEEAYKNGKIKAIGVSNFLVEDIENITDNCEIVPMVNQVLAHVSNTPFELIEYMENKDILVQAYSPIGHGELLKNGELIKIADRYNVSVPQLAIRYVLQLGMSPLPKTGNPDHMKNNADVDFVISDEDMEILKNFKKIENYGEHSFFPVYGGKLK